MWINNGQGTYGDDPRVRLHVERVALLCEERWGAANARVTVQMTLEPYWSTMLKVSEGGLLEGLSTEANC